MSGLTTGMVPTARRASVVPWRPSGAKHVSSVPPRTHQALQLGFHRVSGVRARHRRSACVAYDSTQAEVLLSKGNSKFAAGDRMGALKCYEEALAQDITLNQRRILHYNCTVVHAYFGDIEIAQVTLRDAVNAGLSYDAALKQPEEGMLQLSSSPQVLIQLRKFARGVEDNRAKSPTQGGAEAARRRAEAAAGPSSAVRMSDSGMGTRSSLNPETLRRAVDAEDFSEMVGAEARGIDTSFFGIFRRVALLVLVLAVGGVALWLAGLAYLFPDA